MPFENLDIHLGRPIILDRRFFYKKIVENRRGGYCYELNGCFAWLLKRLGFKVSMLSARVAKKEGGFSPDFDHLTLLVRLGERWLIDVGFGDLFTEPKRVDSADAQQDKGEAYRIVSKGKTMLLLRRSADETTWKSQYAFTLRPRKLEDFVARNRYQQTSARSHFTQGRLISKLTPTGRVTLTDEKLILTKRGKRVEHLVKDKAEFDRLLAEHFQLLLFRGGL
ncbi:MAG TPA: arylamine N-acetyltransferase [Candidatus Bathyarchaeia archaeon]